MRIRARGGGEARGKEGSGLPCLTNTEDDNAAMMGLNNNEGISFLAWNVFFERVLHSVCTCQNKQMTDLLRASKETFRKLKYYQQESPTQLAKNSVKLRTGGNNEKKVLTNAKTWTTMYVCPNINSTISPETGETKINGDKQEQSPIFRQNNAKKKL